MGYSGNCEPNFIVPTLIATKEDKGNQIRAKSDDIPDLDFYIGNEVRSGAHGAPNTRELTHLLPPPPHTRAHPLSRAQRSTCERMRDVPPPLPSLHRDGRRCTTTQRCSPPRSLLPPPPLFLLSLCPLRLNPAPNFTHRCLGPPSILYIRVGGAVFHPIFARTPPPTPRCGLYPFN